MRDENHTYKGTNGSLPHFKKSRTAKTDLYWTSLDNVGKKAVQTKMGEQNDRGEKERQHKENVERCFSGYTEKRTQLYLHLKDKL